MRLYRHRNGKWYADVITNGVRHRCSLKTKDKDTAQRLFRSMLQEQELGRFGLKPALSVTLSHILASYLNHCKATRSPRTYRDSAMHVRLFLDPYMGHMQTASLSQQLIDGFVLQMIEKEYHPRTINLRLETLRKALNWAHRTGMINHSPLRITLIPCPQSMPRYVTPADLRKWLSYLSPEHMQRAELSINTGITDRDIATLLWSDYDAEVNLIRLRRKKTGRFIAIPLNARASEILEELKEKASGPYIFSGVQSVRKAYKTASRKSGIRVTPHMLRHTFATSLLSKGAPLAHVKALLGHGDQKTTEIYAKVLPEYLRETVEKLDGGQKSGTIKKARPLPESRN